MKVFLPLNVRIDHKKILFVGGGKVALHKIKSLIHYTYNITIISPYILPELHDMGFTEIYKEYEAADLEGFFLVYAATNNLVVNQQIRNDATLAGVLVNVVDNRELSDFISPAIIKDGPMTIAVSSNGEDVKRTVALRNAIKAMVESPDWSLEK
uniref:precorrin-2 dehydrogenase n=1 Tax=Chlorobium chlorochromatii (strain CaD3) TaxID=340177 RepID=Q3AP84_CHLCH